MFFYNLLGLILVQSLVSISTKKHCCVNDYLIFLIKVKEATDSSFYHILLMHVRSDSNPIPIFSEYVPAS